MDETGLAKALGWETKVEIPELSNGEHTLMVKIDIKVLGDGRKFARATAWFPESVKANKTKKNKKTVKKKAEQIKIEDEEVY